MKIGFIGVGKLGKDAAEVMAEKHEVIGYDVTEVSPENFKMVPTIKDVCQDRELIFIAVPTPHHPPSGSHILASLLDRCLVHKPKYECK